MLTKVCTWCEPATEKPVEEFYKNPRTKDGLSNRCKDCDSRAHRLYYRKKKSHLISTLKVNYKLTVRQFKKMHREQGGLCAICGIDNSKLVIDHDHNTGDARGLLCNNCNHLLGRAKDSPLVLRRAAEYLERSNAENQTDTIQ